MVIPDTVAEDVQRALHEDVGAGDLTANLIPADSRSEAIVVCREPAILCGQPWFDQVFLQLDPSITIAWNYEDGDRLSEGDDVCRLSGSSRVLLTGERTALNFLQILSATATNAGIFSSETEGTGVKILDTRKTIPGLRRAQKYAVTCGGCENHRMGLYDKILIKENHIAAAGSIGAALRQAFEMSTSDEDVEIEVESLDQLMDALNNGAKHVLLDNFEVPDIATAVQMNRRRALLEVSGGITLENVRVIAETGIDYISVGSLTKYVRAIDFSMRIQEKQG